MITTDAKALEARYGGRSAPTDGKIQELYVPGSGTPPNKQGQIPMGTPVPEGVIIEQRVGRAQAAGAPSMAVMPPQVNQGPQPSMMVMPPSGAGRTTIGTFTESPQMFAGQPPSQQPWAGDPNARPTQAVSPSVSLPLIESKASKPQRKLDLIQLILDHMHELGGADSEACQKFYDRSPQSLKQYTKNPGAMPMECFLKFLGKKPGVMVQIAEELEPHFAANGREGWAMSLPNRSKTDMMLCSPILERPTLPYVFLVGHLMKKYEMGWNIQADTMVPRSRNMLAHRFLESGVQWSLWVDGDMAAPIGKPDWYKSVTVPTAIPEESVNYEVVARMLGHGKPVVGAVYAGRKWRGALVIQPEIHPRGQDDKLFCNEVRRGTARGLYSVDWVGFGCALVHREVFLEVQRRFPQLAPQAEFAPWRFFQVEGDEGEDEAFCKRVKACGIPIWLDSQLVCGHVGSMAFLPEHTAPKPGI